MRKALIALYKIQDIFLRALSFGLRLRPIFDVVLKLAELKYK